MRFAPPGPDNPAEFAGLLKPARELGGDLYDFFRMDDGAYVFVIGDVSDKGVPAALFMARTLGTVRLIASTYRTAAGYPTDPGSLLSEMNAELCRNNDASMFVTLLLGMIDPQTRTLKFANAGHNDPYHLTKQGKLARATATKGLPAGVRAATRYETQVLEFGPGDTFFAYTDGVTDAANARQEQYAEQRLEAALAGLAGRKPSEIVTAVTESISQFVDGAPPADDIAMLTVRLAAPS